MVCQKLDEKGVKAKSEGNRNVETTEEGLEETDEGVEQG